jgi:hypothetical protein
MPPRKLIPGPDGLLIAEGSYKSHYKKKVVKYIEKENIMDYRRDNDFICYFLFPETNGHVLKRHAVTEQEVINEVLDKWPELAQKELI